jgi:hypothetical protein
VSDPERKCLLGEPNLGTILRIFLLGAAFLCLALIGLGMAAYLVCP